MSDNKEVIRDPSYYVRQRLLRNRPAMVGFVLVLLAHLIAMLGYLIMPDSTPYANDGSPLIKKQERGFEVDFLLTAKTSPIQERNFFGRMLWGQEIPYNIEPLDTLYLSGDSVYFKPFGKSEEDWQRQHLLTTVLPVYGGESNKLGVKHSFVKSKNGFRYLDLHEQVQEISMNDLRNRFGANNISHRKYWLGTDKSGRDMLSRLIFGTRISLSIGFIAVVISVFVGVTLGALGGYFGGWIDRILTWLLTVTWSIPGIMLVIAISLALKSKGIWVAFIAVGLTMWVEVARVVRGQILSIKEKQFIEAARALGMNNFRIIFKHVLPNVMGALIVIATANFASAILIEAGLSFLGLGVQPPMPSWGMMVNEGYNSNWESDGGWLVLLPSFCISTLVFAFNLFGNGLRDAYDPRSQVKW